MIERVRIASNADELAPALDLIISRLNDGSGSGGGGHRQKVYGG